ncbi:MAG: thymidine kinase [Hyphomonadaceae bacterium]|nr:thymidine kinase [Hyphomonadaceae bacterium]
MAKLYFHFGAMNAGKSMLLLRSAYNYAERNMRAVVFKPDIDTRNGHNDVVSSRIGLSAQAKSFCRKIDIADWVVKQHKAAKIDCIFFDEAQFLTQTQVWQLASIVDDLDIPVMCYGLRTDFKGDLFEGSAALLAIADSVMEIKTLCWCAHKATMTVRVDEDGEVVKDGTQIKIGDNDRYVSLCRRHWKAQMPEAPC